jgi:hypothetical protein
VQLSHAKYFQKVYQTTANRIGIQKLGLGKENFKHKKYQCNGGDYYKQEPLALNKVHNILQ